MSGLSPQERNEVIDEIQGLLEDLREDPYGIDIRGCREAAGLLLAVVMLVLAGYVFLRFEGPTRALIMGIILGIAAVSLGVYILVRATR